MKVSTNRPVEALGENFLATVAESIWGWGWQPYSKRSDDGLDGVLLVRKDGNPTGDIIHVQVKSGTSYKRHPKHDPTKLGVKVGIEYVESHRKMWRNFKDPVILIYVEPSTDAFRPNCWWADLKSSDCYSAKCMSYLLVDKKQRFTQGSLKDLCILSQQAKLLALSQGKMIDPYLEVELALKLRSEGVIS